jgi:CRP-like cAMP-binding protein
VISIVFVLSSCRSREPLRCSIGNIQPSLLQWRMGCSRHTKCYMFVRNGAHMPRSNKLPADSDTLSSGASLGGTVSHYRREQNIYTQGTPAGSLFYIRKGEVRLTKQLKNRRLTVTAILGEGDFFGTQCLIGYPLRLSTAVAD